MASRAENVYRYRQSIHMHGTKSGPGADPDYAEKYHPGGGVKRGRTIKGKIGDPVDASSQPKKGDCFANCARHITLYENKPNMRLVHGFVTGTGGGIEGVRYPHAWLEYDVPLPEEWVKLFPGMKPIRNAMDLTTDERLKDPLELPADVYRSIGQATVIAEYTADEARKLSLKTGHWGPWEPELLRWYGEDE